MMKTAFLTGPIALAAVTDHLRAEKIELPDDVPLTVGLRIKFKPRHYDRDVVFTVETITFNLKDDTYALAGSASNAP
jgi:hypothetical protein